MGGEIGKQPELRAGQAHRPGASRARGRRQVLAQLPRVLDERAQVRAGARAPRSASENTVRAAGTSPSARWARVSSSPTWTVSHGMRGRAGAAGGGRASAPRGHPRAAPRGARRAPPRRARARSSSSRRGPSPRPAPGPAVPAPGLAPGGLPRGEERELRLGDVHVLHGAAGQRRVDGRREVGSRPIGGAEQRVGDASEAQRGWLASRFPGRAARGPAPRPRARARRRPPSCPRAGWRPRARSWRCRRRAGSAEVAPSASESHRSASAVRPVSARNQAP